jgi:hypothetical protein
VKTSNHISDTRWGIFHIHMGMRGGTPEVRQKSHSQREQGLHCKPIKDEYGSTPSTIMIFIRCHDRVHDLSHVSKIQKSKIQNRLCLPLCLASNPRTAQRADRGSLCGKINRSTSALSL